MKDKINQLEILINEIIELIEQHKEIAQIDLGEYDTMYKNTIRSFEGMEEYVAAFRKTIVDYKNDPIFYKENIPKIKALLLNTLKTINHISSLDKKVFGETKSGSNGLTPNQDFINLLRKGVIKSDQEIFGTFKRKTVFGYLTEDGFFEVNIEAKNYSALTSPLLHYMHGIKLVLMMDGICGLQLTM